MAATSSSLASERTLGSAFALRRTSAAPTWPPKPQELEVRTRESETTPDTALKRQYQAQGGAGRLGSLDKHFETKYRCEPGHSMSLFPFMLRLSCFPSQVCCTSAQRYEMGS